MSKARLIKHREWLEREQAAQRQARLSPVAQVKVDAVRDWVKRQQASQRKKKSMPMTCQTCLRLSTLRKPLRSLVNHTTCDECQPD